MAVDTIDHPKKADMERWGAEAKVTGIYFGVPVAVPVAAAPAPPTSSRNAHMARRKLGTFPNLTLRPEKPALGNGGAQKHARWALWVKATKTAAHGGKLGSSNFSDIVRRLFKAGRIKGGGKRGAVFQVVAGQVASSSTNAPPNTPHSRVKDPGVRSDSSGHSGSTPGAKDDVQNVSHN